MYFLYKKELEPNISEHFDSCKNFSEVSQVGALGGGTLGIVPYGIETIIISKIHGLLVMKFLRDDYTFLSTTVRRKSPID